MVNNISQVKNKLTILSLNIQTINTKFDGFENNIGRYKSTSSIKCNMQETHLEENVSTLNFELNDYQLISKGRYCSNAGGLIIYIHNYYNFKHVDISSEISDSDETKPIWEKSYLLK